MATGRLRFVVHILPPLGGEEKEETPAAISPSIEPVLDRRKPLRTIAVPAELTDSFTDVWNSIEARDIAIHPEQQHDGSYFYTLQGSLGEHIPLTDSLDDLGISRESTREEMVLYMRKIAFDREPSLPTDSSLLPQNWEGRRSRHMQSHPRAERSSVRSRMQPRTPNATYSPTPATSENKTAKPRWLAHEVRVLKRYLEKGYTSQEIMASPHGINRSTTSVRKKIARLSDQEAFIDKRIKQQTPVSRSRRLIKEADRRPSIARSHSPVNTQPNTTAKSDKLYARAVRMAKAAEHVDDCYAFLKLKHEQVAAVADGDEQEILRLKSKQRQQRREMRIKYGKDPRAKKRSLKRKRDYDDDSADEEVDRMDVDDQHSGYVSDSEVSCIWKSSPRDPMSDATLRQSRQIVNEDQDAQSVTSDWSHDEELPDYMDASETRVDDESEVEADDNRDVKGHEEAQDREVDKGTERREEDGEGDEVEDDDSGSEEEVEEQSKLPIADKPPSARDPASSDSYSQSSDSEDSDHSNQPVDTPSPTKQDLVNGSVDSGSTQGSSPPMKAEPVEDEIADVATSSIPLPLPDTQMSEVADPSKPPPRQGAFKVLKQYKAPPRGSSSGRGSFFGIPTWVKHGLHINPLPPAKEKTPPPPVKLPYASDDEDDEDDDSSESSDDDEEEEDE